MVKQLARNLFALLSALLAALGFATGIALGCSGQYCTANVSGCVQLSNETQVTCCVSGYCRNCWRYEYDCAGTVKYGPPFNCQNPLSSCS